MERLSHSLSLAGVAAAVALLSCGEIFAQSQPVEVTNGRSDPALVADVEKPARRPFQWSGQFNNDSTVVPYGDVLTPLRPNARTVIEFLSASCSNDGSGGDPYMIRVTTDYDYFFSMETRPFGNGSVSVATHKTLMYIEPGDDALVAVFPSAGIGYINCSVSMSGYYIRP